MKANPPNCEYCGQVIDFSTATEYQIQRAIARIARRAGKATTIAIAGAIAPYAMMAGTASAFLGVVQMGVAAIVGIAVGHLHDGTARAMTGALAIVALGALISRLALVGRGEASSRAV